MFNAEQTEEEKALSEGETHDIKREEGSADDWSSVDKNSTRESEQSPQINHAMAE